MSENSLNHVPLVTASLHCSPTSNEECFFSQSSVYSTAETALYLSIFHLKFSKHERFDKLKLG